ncbi:MAG: hypothetical protein Q7S01_05570 [bacterium]|nr:hypothetical protein [bacterium]
MDETRDTKKTDSLSRLLDGGAVRTNPFGRNVSGEKSYRRAERLVAALHLITSHISEHEPIRKSARATSIELLSGLLSLRDEMRSVHSEKVRSVQATVRQLISLVRILAVSGLVSPQNTDVIVEAVDELGNFINLAGRTPLSESVVLSRDDLLSGTLAREKRNLVKDRLATAVSNTDAGVSIRTDNGSITDIQRDIGISKTSMTTRRSEIIAVLRSVKDAGIRDVASSLPEYSEKMIQRELAALVAVGQVKKTGLKRWSKYSLLS